MNTHPYVRAYLSGVLLPTIVLPVILAGALATRRALGGTFLFERGMVFPLAFVPVLWGLWNMLWLGTQARIHQPLGLHGAVLPFLLMPAGATMASSLGFLSLGVHGATWFQACEVPYTLILSCFLAAVAGYYLLWKYVVGFANRALGIG